MDDVEVKTPKKKMIKVNVIRYGSNTVLVEYMVKGHAQRSLLPPTDVIDGAVEETVLDAGFPYGVPWEEIDLPTLTVQDLADALHKYEIWTPEDAIQHPDVVQGVVGIVTGDLVSRILELATKYKPK